MIVTDDTETVSRLRQYRARGISDRGSVVAPTRPPLQAEMSDIQAAIGLVQLARLDGILQRRRQVEALYFEYMKSFEGIKDPYHGPDATAVHWFVYEVHLGTRFSRSSRALSPISAPRVSRRPLTACPCIPNPIIASGAAVTVQPPCGCPTAP